MQALADGKINYIVECNPLLGEKAAELVPAEPPTPLRARVAAGLARSLIVARDYEGARRRGEEALAVLRACSIIASTRRCSRSRCRRGKAWGR